MKHTPTIRTVTLAAVVCLLLFAAWRSDGVERDDPPRKTAAIALEQGFQIERISSGLNFPTGLTWDDGGRMYVVEAGGGLLPEQLAPMRLLRVDGEEKTVIADLGDAGVMPAVVGLAWHDGAFYITHRAEDLTGAVSRVSMNGEVELVFDGIVDNQAEHQINDIRVGPDGRLYVAVGLAGNAGVVGPSIAPWVMMSPNLHPRPCEDIVLLGKNFKTPNFLTEEEGDSTLTGAFVPFGTATQPGQVIPGVEKCGGSILTFDPADAEGTIQTYAWGFRNLIGLAWDPQSGVMYAAENGYDVRGSRPVKGEIDASLRIQEGVWYGVPDFSASRRPLTDETFEVPDSLQAGIFIDGVFQGKDLGFVIDHAASGLTPPDPSLVVGRHEFNSSPSMLDVAPASWEEFAGHLFVAEWGDLAPPTNPLRGKMPAGSQVVRIDPTTGEMEAFVRNMLPGPASMQGAAGEGLERPFNVRFGPDGAMYIVDYGVTRIDTTQTPPYVFEAGTGAIWKVSRITETSVEQLDSDLPGSYALDQNYPNPFNPSTSIRFQVAEQGRVTLRIYDAAGREVMTLVNREFSPGTYQVQWSGNTEAGVSAPAGVYFYRLDAAGFSETKSMTLLK